VDRLAKDANRSFAAGGSMQAYQVQGYSQEYWTSLGGENLSGNRLCTELHKHGFALLAKTQ
jgi:hypothetical protein